MGFFEYFESPLFYFSSPFKLTFLSYKVREPLNSLTPFTLSWLQRQCVNFGFPKE